MLSPKKSQPLVLQNVTLHVNSAIRDAVIDDCILEGKPLYLARRVPLQENTITEQRYTGRRL